MKLDLHDAKVIGFHAVITIIQLVLIGYKVENPVYAPIVNTVLEVIRRFAF